MSGNQRAGFAPAPIGRRGMGRPRVAAEAGEAPPPPKKSVAALSGALESREEGGPVDNGASIGGDVPLVRKLRLAMGRQAGWGTKPRPAVVRREVSDLMDRLDRLHQCFPDSWELLDRVTLSGHVLGLLGEARGLPMALGAGMIER